jgi:hypothetical protein
LRRQAPVDHEFGAGGERGFVAGEAGRDHLCDLSERRNLASRHMLFG